MNAEYINIYNNLINLTRNKNLFYNFTNKDTFSDRLLIFMFHLGFFLRNFKNQVDKKYLQEFYDYTFRQIELDVREIGYGDASINKKMKTYVNILYSIINKINNWHKLSNIDKFKILKYFLEIKKNDKELIKYFDNYVKYLSKITLKSFTKSVLEHKF
tara:strand:+ start:7181 stop:7654 length:474 start_codon:yes stop_codon:yes gene_type:complete